MRALILVAAADIDAEVDRAVGNIAQSNKMTAAQLRDRFESNLNRLFYAGIPFVGGPERVIDLVAARAPDGFASIEDVATHAELAGIVRGYAQLAGFSVKQ